MNIPALFRDFAAARRRVSLVDRLDAIAAEAKRPIRRNRPEMPIATWAEHQAADRVQRRVIEAHWCSVGHGFSGDGSQRDLAMTLYCRAVAARRKAGDLPPVKSAPRFDAFDVRGDDELYDTRRNHEWGE